MQRRPAVVGPLSHGSRIVPELSPHVRMEPERASFEQVRASAAIEEQTDHVLLAGVRRHEDGRVALFVPGVREVRALRQQILDGLRVIATDDAEQFRDSAHRSSAEDESGAWIANGGLRPRERRRRLLDDLVPRTGEATLGALFRKRLLTMPLTAGQLVVGLEPVSVGIREIDTDRDGMVRDADGDLFGLQPLIHFREVFEAPHSPRHVVQAHLLLLRSQGVFTHLEEGDVMRMARVAREEGCAQLGRSRKGHGVLRVEAEDVRIPLVRALGVAHEDVDVVERNGLVGHVPVSCEQNRVSRGVYAILYAAPRSRRKPLTVTPSAGWKSSSGARTKPIRSYMLMAVCIRSVV